MLFEKEKTGTAAGQLCGLMEDKLSYCVQSRTWISQPSLCVYSVEQTDPSSVLIIWHTLRGITAARFTALREGKCVQSIKCCFWREETGVFKLCCCIHRWSWWEWLILLRMWTQASSTVTNCWGNLFRHPKKRRDSPPRHVCFSSGPGSFRTQRADTLVIWSLLCITAWAHFWEMPCSVAKYHCVIRQSVKIMPRILSMLCAVLGKLLGKCRELSYRQLCIKRCPMTLKLPHREM